MSDAADAWDAADAASARAGVRVERLETLADLDGVATVVERTWGGQAFQREILRAFQHAGCVLLGARARGSTPDELVGFVFGFLGQRDGLHLHSHMLAVLEPWQARGVGFALKLAQRAAALDAGVLDMRWTFDPMLLRNARFNLVKLGTVGVRFLRDFYGAMQDEVNRGERSDRFEASWPLLSERVGSAVAGQGTAASDDGVVVLAAGGDPDAPTPVPGAGGPAERSLVAIPRDHMALRRRDRGLASAWREAAAEAFGACFDAGLVATGVTGGGLYVFEREAR